MIELFHIDTRPTKEEVEEIWYLINLLSPSHARIDIKQALRHYFAQEMFLSAVKRVDDKIVGFGSLFILEKMNYGMSYVGLIEDVVVHDEYRGKGYGAEIVNELCDQAKLDGCYKVILNCSEDNIKFYEGLGFNQAQVMMRKDIY